MNLASKGLAVLALTALAGAASAQDPGAVNPERYIPGVWVDPDGCQHWVMDDGTEGYMEPRLTRDGRPVCDAAAASAQPAPVLDAERYVPGIWVDPDGCEHWVMDDGSEGFMDARRDREGRPVCRVSASCGILSADQFFPTDQFALNAASRSALEAFFRDTPASGYRIQGHTDSVASDAYNVTLSNNRANAVAAVAASVGASVVEVVGLGERQPRATNDTAEGRQANRRVEILCAN